MTSKILVLKFLERLFVMVAVILLLVTMGFPAEWLLRAVGLSCPDFQAFALFILFSALLLIHAIATSDSAP